MFQRLSPGVLGEIPFLTALRLLASVQDPRWHDAVGAVRIDWARIYAFSRAPGTDSSMRLTIELAGSLYGDARARPELYLLGRRLDDAHYRAYLDALRLTGVGLVHEEDPAA